MNMVVAFLLSLNIWFYGDLTWQFAPYLRIVFIISAVFWAMIQMYTFPFMIEQEEPSIKIALRNSLVAVARYPLRSFGTLLLVLAIAFVSTNFFSLILWFVVSIALIVYVSTKNTVVVLEKLIEKEKEMKQREEEKQDSTSGE